MGNFNSGRQDAADAEGERDANTDVKGLDAENKPAAPRTVQRPCTPAPRWKAAAPAATAAAAAPSGVDKKGPHLCALLLHHPVWTRRVVTTSANQPLPHLV